MINEGVLLALLTRFVHGVFNGGGDLRLRLHFYRANIANKGININAMHNLMINLVL